MSFFLILVLVLTLCAELVNGWTDAPNAIATVVSTRVMSLRMAIFMAVAMNTLGALTGTAVATTIGTGIVDPTLITLPVIASALIAIVVWGTLAAQFGLPTSETHALVAGLAGAGLAVAGPGALLLSGWIKISIGLIASSFFGFGISYLVGKAIFLLGLKCNWRPGPARKMFDRLQILSAGLMAYNHGMNDGQKFIGVFTIALVVGGVIPSFQVLWWVALLCAVVMGIGTSLGGKNIISMLGEKMTNIQSWQGFGAEISSSGVIFASSLAGVPISSTHTISTSIMGVAASRRMSAVQWFQSRKIVFAWVATFPICGLIGYAIAWLFVNAIPVVQHACAIFSLHFM
jgi:PiT family inorganic phosphate transporter